MLSRKFSRTKSDHWKYTLIKKPVFSESLQLCGKTNLKQIHLKFLQYK